MLVLLGNATFTTKILTHLERTFQNEHGLITRGAYNELLLLMGKLSQSTSKAIAKLATWLGAQLDSGATILTRYGLISVEGIIAADEQTGFLGMVVNNNVIVVDPSNELIISRTAYALATSGEAYQLTAPEWDSQGPAMNAVNVGGFLALLGMDPGEPKTDFTSTTVFQRDRALTTGDSAVVTFTATYDYQAVMSDKTRRTAYSLFMYLGRQIGRQALASREETALHRIDALQLMREKEDKEDAARITNELYGNQQSSETVVVPPDTGMISKDRLPSDTVYDSDLAGVAAGINQVNENTIALATVADNVAHMEQALDAATAEVTVTSVQLNQVKQHMDETTYSLNDTKNKIAQAAGTLNTMTQALNNAHTAAPFSAADQSGPAPAPFALDLNELQEATKELVELTSTTSAATDNKDKPFKAITDETSSAAVASDAVQSATEQMADASEGVTAEADHMEQMAFYTAGAGAGLVSKSGQAAEALNAYIARDVSGTTPDLTDITNRLVALEGWQSGIDATLTTVRTDIQALSTKVNSIEVEQQVSSTLISSMSMTLGALETEVTGLSNSVDNINARLDILESAGTGGIAQNVIDQINDNTNEIVTINGRVTAVELSVAGEATARQQLAQDVSAQGLLVSGNKQQIDANALTISSHTTSIQSLTASGAQRDNAILTNATDIAANEGRIDGLTGPGGSIPAQQAQIDALNKEVYGTGGTHPQGINAELTYQMQVIESLINSDNDIMADIETNKEGVRANTTNIAAIAADPKTNGTDVAALQAATAGLGDTIIRLNQCSNASLRMSSAAYANSDETASYILPQLWYNLRSVLAAVITLGAPSNTGNMNYEMPIYDPPTRNFATIGQGMVDATDMHEWDLNPDGIGSISLPPKISRTFMAAYPPPPYGVDDNTNVILPGSVHPTIDEAGEGMDAEASSSGTQIRANIATLL